MAGSRWVLQGKKSRESGLDLMEILDRISGFALASLLWLFLSLPVITMPAATAGLFSVTSAWARHKPSELFRDFFWGMRRFWWKSTQIVLLEVAVGGLVVINLSILRQMNTAGTPLPLSIFSLGITVFGGLLALLVNLFVWPLLVVFDLPLRKLLELALVMVFNHLGRSFLLLVVGLCPLLLGLVLPVGIMILVAFSACALLINWGAWQVIRLYVDDDQLLRLEVKQTAAI